MAEAATEPSPLRRKSSSSGGWIVNPWPAQAPHLTQDLVEGLARDELHDVVVHALVLADAVNRDDVRVVQPGRGAGLALESGRLLRVEPAVPQQDFQGHVPAERLLLGLVDDAHAAAADFADDPEVSQLLQRRHGRDVAVRRVSLVAHSGFVLLHQQERGEQCMDPIGPLRVALGVLGW